MRVTGASAASVEPALPLLSSVLCAVGAGAGVLLLVAPPVSSVVGGKPAVILLSRRAVAKSSSSCASASLTSGRSFPGSSSNTALIAASVASSYTGCAWRGSSSLESNSGGLAGPAKGGDASAATVEPSLLLISASLLTSIGPGSDPGTV